MRHILPLILAAGPALADCPPGRDHSDAIADALSRLQNAERDMDARAVTSELWHYWLEAPDAVAQRMLDEGMARREMFDFEGSAAVLTQLVEYCPNYAEGYNQRAFTYFVSGSHSAALEDLARAVDLNPAHIGALSGMGLVLIELGRPDEAQDWLRRALALNPFLSERALIREPPGEDI